MFNNGKEKYEIDLGEIVGRKLNSIGETKLVHTIPIRTENQNVKLNYAVYTQSIVLFIRYMMIKNRS